MFFFADGFVFMGAREFDNCESGALHFVMPFPW